MEADAVPPGLLTASAGPDPDEDVEAAGEAPPTAESLAGSDEQSLDKHRRWTMPSFESPAPEEPIRSKLADLAETVGQEPLNNGARYEMAIALESADPAQAVAQYAIIREFERPPTRGRHSPTARGAPGIRC